MSQKTVEKNTLYEELNEAWEELKKTPVDQRSSIQAKINRIEGELIKIGATKKDGSPRTITDFSAPYKPKSGFTAKVGERKFFGKKELTQEDISAKAETFFAGVLPIATKHAKQIAPVNTSPEQINIIVQALTKAVAIYLSR